MEQAVIATAWFGALVGGVFGGLSVSQAITGRPTFPHQKRIDWSLREIRLLGLGWAIYWSAMTIYVLVASLEILARQDLPLLPLAMYPVAFSGLVFQGLMEQRHHGRWPFKDRVSRT